MALSMQESLVSFFLLLFFGASCVLCGNENQGAEAVWEITKDAQSVDHSVSRNLMLAIEGYRILNDGKYPNSFGDLNDEIVNQLARSLGRPIEDQFKLIDKHEALHNEHLKGWKLVMITKLSMDIGRSDNTTGRHLVYADATGELKHITETESWFAKWIGDAIPGIRFGDDSNIGPVKKTTAEIPPTPSVPEVAEEIEKVPQPKPATTETSEVTTPEPSEEPDEKPSNWWLWLVGLLVVVGGVGLVVRRKS